jgi:PEP-CTERM motif-containing protein
MKLFAAILLLASLLPAQDRHDHTNGAGHDHNGQHGHNGNGNGHHKPPKAGEDQPGQPVPEPATLFLVGTGIIAVAVLRRRRAEKEQA